MSDIFTGIVSLLASRLSAQAVTVFGLVLALVYAWYQLHRAKLLELRLDLEDEKRRFIVEQYEAAHTTLVRQQQPVERAGAAVASILVVEDEAALGYLAREMLARHFRGADVQLAANGEEAMVLIAERLPDLLVTDVVMPRMGGVELLAALKAKGLTIPTLVISGYVDTHYVISKVKAESQFLAKPFSRSDLVSAVEEVLSKGKHPSNEQDAG